MHSSDAVAGKGLILPSGGNHVVFLELRVETATSCFSAQLCDLFLAGLSRQAAGSCHSCPCANWALSRWG